ncbi:MAG TPA: hypothetical protein VFS32_04170 [Candidatus Limnocylindrales bacterium]|nr:hypothetical protein [Candidatus Limnocylindrales bacterium]
MLPVFERLAPAPPAAFVAGRIEALTAPGDVVVDLHGRGGWVARAAIDRQRRALSIESSPLARLLAELVLRPPDLRHLDAAFAAVGTAPRGESSVRAWIADRWATRCPTCERLVTLDELVWEQAPSEPDGLPEPVTRTFRCSVCREPRPGGTRHLPPDDEDLARARSDRDDEDAARARERLRERFPVLEPGSGLADELLDIHSSRQLAGLAAILERIESDLRAAPVESALRVAFLHAVLPASRLNAYPGRVGSLRIANGRARYVLHDTWRERNPWLAFEDGYRLVRSFLQRLESAALPPVQARYAPDVRALADGSGSAVVRLGTPSAYRALADEAKEMGERRDRVRLVIATAPPRPSPERLALAYHATAWALGREAASLLPLEGLFGGSVRVPWSWQAGSLRRSLAAAGPLLPSRPDARALVLVDAAPEAVVAAAIGAAGARYTLVDVRPVEPDAPGGPAHAVLELAAPGSARPPGPRTRANVPLEPVAGGPGDPDLVPGSGLFSAPEPVEARPFSASEAERAITEAAVEALRARGEPADEATLLGEILLGLDRAGHLRRYALTTPAERVEPEVATGAAEGPDAARAGADAGHAAARPSDAVETLLALVRAELTRPTNRRLTQVAPGTWWLGDRSDRDEAAAPLADRLEWATYSLLSTGGPLSERAFADRIGSMFRGPDRPDPSLVAATLASYRSRASTAERLLTNDELAARTHEHAELIALLAETGHRLGLGVWIAAREQRRRIGGRELGEWLEREERTAWLGGIAAGRTEALEEVDVAWYARGRLTFLFEVEWTAMLAEPLLGRHALIPPAERLVRFLVVPPERAELVRAKFDASPLFRSVVEAQNWHVLKWNHLRTFAALEAPTLESLEPFVGLDPGVERSGEQLPLFSLSTSAADPAEGTADPTVTIETRSAEASPG